MMGKARGMLAPGNIDLDYRPVVRNEDGSQSNIRSMSFGDSTGREILIPTVAFGKIMSNHEAIQRYMQTGQHLGIFDSPEAATEYAQMIHEIAARRAGLGN